MDKPETQKETDVGSQLRDAAIKTDRGEEVDLTEVAKANQAAPPPAKSQEKTSGEESSAQQEKSEAEKASGAKSGTTATDKETGKSPETKTADSSTTDKTVKETEEDKKAEKERQREKTVLSNFQKEKEEFRAEMERNRQEIARQRAEIERARGGAPGTDGQGPRYTARDYHLARNNFIQQAKGALREGDYAKAAELMETAEKAGMAADKTWEDEQRQALESHQKGFMKKWEGDMVKVMQSNPEFKDKESPLAKEVAVVLGMADPLDPSQPNIFERMDNGFAYAVEVAKLRLEAALASGLQEKVKELETKLAAALEKTQLETSGPTIQSQQKKLSDMSLEEQRAALRARAVEYDRAA